MTLLGKDSLNICTHIYSVVILEFFSDNMENGKEKVESITIS